MDGYLETHVSWDSLALVITKFSTQGDAKFTHKLDLTNT